MPKKPEKAARVTHTASTPVGRSRPSAVVDTRVIYCRDNSDQLRKLPEHSVDLIYSDPPLDLNRNYDVCQGGTKEKRVFEDRRASGQAYVSTKRPTESSNAH